MKYVRNGASCAPKAATPAPTTPDAKGRQQNIVAATVPADVTAPASDHWRRARIHLQRSHATCFADEVFDDRALSIARRCELALAHLEMMAKRGAEGVELLSLLF